MKGQDDIQIIKSGGFGKNGKAFYYVRPIYECFNGSRRAEGIAKTENLIRKWYYPKVILYVIEDRIIGSNSKENALREYWRVCKLSDVGKLFEVAQLKPNNLLNHDRIK